MNPPESTTSATALRIQGSRADTIGKVTAYIGTGVSALLLGHALSSDNFYLAQVSYIGFMGGLFGGAILYGDFSKKKE